MLCLIIGVWGVAAAGAGHRSSVDAAPTTTTTTIATTTTTSPPLSPAVLQRLAYEASAELSLGAFPGAYAGISQEEGTIVVTTYLDRKGPLAGTALAACNGMINELDQAGERRAILVEASDGGYIAYHWPDSGGPCTPSRSVHLG